MPATESTWRNLNRVHVVFGIASLAMLVTTIWMLADDHNRSWKNYQRKFRDIETWSANARIDEQSTSEFDLTTHELHGKLRSVEEAALTPAGEELFAKFIALAKTKTEADDEEQARADAAAADIIAADVQKLAKLQGGTEEQQRKERRDLRMDLFNRLNDFVGRVRFREDTLTQNLKFRKAALDKGLATYSIAVGEGASPEHLAELQQEVDQVRSDVDGLSHLQELVKTHRTDLEGIVREITSEREQAVKNLADHKHTLEQLEKAEKQRRANVGKQVLEMPILDAFNSPLKVDQIWLPNLTLNNNFRDVARFDRCNTCHQAIDKTQPGSAVQPAYPQERTLTVSLATPKDAPQPQKDSADHEVPVNVEQVYGFRLADQGVVNSDDVTVSAVLPKSPAAIAGLLSGDVIAKIGDAPVLDVDRALHNLLGNVKWGTPIELTVRRGMPHPYSSHPRLDLFLGSLSPHPTGKFGCTICHQGQGSATSFEWASHTPSSPQQADVWAHDYGWFNNHNWLFPMFPQQFRESGCLKCHHEVVDLEPSARFPDPPAPTLVNGYEIIRNYGCFGCHEINGYNGPQKRVGPDLRTEPVFYAAAAQLRADPGFEKLPDEVRGWVDELVRHPENDDVRRRLYEFVSSEGQAKSPALTPVSLHMESLLKDVETPGNFRKVGPSLRFVGSKDSYEFLYSWIRNPRDFRPSTKMPRFFGLWNHLVPAEKLDANGQPVLDAHGSPIAEPSGGLLEAQRFEPIEVRAIVYYLLGESQHFEYLKPDSGITAQPSVQRGQKAFELRGCLACHQMHIAGADGQELFPQAKATQGPDLSRIGAKLGLRPFGAQWLYSWLKDPSHYHARTVMPNTMLTPINETGGGVSDPIADIVQFLMQSTAGWKPTDVPPEKELTKADHDALFDLAVLYLKEKFPAEKAKQYIESGIPASRASGVTGAEALLLRGDTENQAAQQTPQVLKYVGRRAIAKYGCSGCHDIPGFEDAKSIGTSLADWGRKDPARLAFEQIGEYITHHAWPSDQKSDAGAQHNGHGNAAPENLDYAIRQLGPIQGWLMGKLLGHEREGFLWQKLHEPRSFDFKKTENKGFNERLRMPQFSFNEDEIEAVMTFVLGLVSEPPAPQYIASYSNNPRMRSIIAGTKTVEQFNCGGCHQLNFQRWDVAFKPGELGGYLEAKDFPFELPHFTPAEIDASQKIDRRGLFHGQLYGQPLVTATGEPATQTENEEGDPFEGGGVGVRFVLWRDTLLEGKPWIVGAKNPLVPENRVTAKFAGRGGDLARWIFPAVIADELKVNPNAKTEEAWGWLPPPLVGEGKKVQTRWLHEFLLEPFAIRPAVVLRMPKFNMSSADSSALVDFFAARDDAPAPYEFNPRTSSEHIQMASLSHPKLLDDALRIVTDNNYCVKCHLVGDFTPAGSVRALAPQLDRVSERLRPDYVHRWVGNPKRILPYTGMPVNIPFDKPVSQSLFPGNSDQQLDGVVDLLMNWNRLTKERFTVKPLIKPAAPPATQPASGE